MRTIFIEIEENTLNWVIYAILSHITLFPVGFGSYQAVIRKTN